MNNSHDIYVPSITTETLSFPPPPPSTSSHVTQDEVDFGLPPPKPTELRTNYVDYAGLYVQPNSEEENYNGFYNGHAPPPRPPLPNNDYENRFGLQYPENVGHLV